MVSKRQRWQRDSLRARRATGQGWGLIVEARLDLGIWPINAHQRSDILGYCARHVPASVNTCRFALTLNISVVKLFYMNWFLKGERERQVGIDGERGKSKLQVAEAAACNISTRA